MSDESTTRGMTYAKAATRATRNDFPVGLTPQPPIIVIVMYKPIIVNIQINELETDCSETMTKGAFFAAVSWYTPETVQMG